MIIAFQTLIYFRESLLTVLDWLIPIWPYYKKWSLAKNGVVSEESDEDQVFADYDEEKGVVFFPPVYAQRYAAVADCLMDERWAGRIEKVVDFGYNDMSFIKYLKDVPGIKCILGVDIESLPLRCSSDLLGGDEYAPKKESPLQITVYQGNAADPDYRLIGCDAVVAIEMIEHMLPHDLERFVHTVFGFIKPQLAVFTTPNGDFNVLFKALEKNGLRRLDHFFEWSREQFHDWCSNIVARYPDYTVTCKGVGPGPAGTHRLGCCSQLALFVCKDYHKQPDLDLNCLALVANAPKHNDLDDMTDSWDSPDPITETNMLCAPDNCESYPELLFSEKQSYMTVVFDSHDQYINNLEYKDKTSQCNIEAERGKNFLMFDEDILCYNVLIPQRKFITKEYEFEDVASRLNCSNFQVKKFSKTTQNLMARNKLDSLVHTREIVDEIRHMTKMLNFDKRSLNKSSIEGGNVWNNINWGDNAPYWNQYYKIVKEFNYPFETKSDEVRILDLISDEINRLVDSHDNQFSVDTNKLEIPLEHLMQVVKHITDDVEKVKDLLDWNGYEIVDNVLIYSRLVVDNTSVGSMDDEWQDNDVLSDWDTTDGQSMSDASTMMPDVYGRSLRRALDLKVKKLRSLLTADEDITTELDRVVCRLLKLAIHTSKDHQTPPPASWMQRKLLDLLSLTEKAIERRRKYSIENYPLKSIQYETHDDARYKIKNNETVERILNKYLTLSSDIGHENVVFKSEEQYNEDNLSATSNEMEPFVLEPNSTYGQVRMESIKSESKEEIRLQITQAWLDGDYDVPNPADYNINSNVNSSTSNTSNDSLYDIKKLDKGLTRHHGVDKYIGSANLLKRKQANKIKARSSKNRLIKKVSKKRSSSGQLARSYSKKLEYFEYQRYTLNNPKSSIKDHQNLEATPSKPIPRSLIELCYQDLAAEKNDNFLDFSIQPPNNYIDSVAATKESFLIDIISEDKEETIALRRTIATEVDGNSDIMESEALLETVVNVTKDDSFDGGHVAPIDKTDSDTIFLYDLNEPSTSKGIRHVSADVQCGTDILAVCPTPTAVSSLVKMSNIRETGIKIEDSFTKLNNSVDFGTLTDENNFYCDFMSVFNKKSLKIRDSHTDHSENVERSTMTQENDSDAEIEHNQSVVNVINKRNSTVRSSQSPFYCVANINNVMSKKISLTKYLRPKLSCCGIYVHSYRERQVSEDVVFQGEWQKNGPKVVVKKSPQMITRKREISIKKRKVQSKENVSPLRQENKIKKVVEKKSVSKQNTRYTDIKREVVTKNFIKKSSNGNENSLSKNVRRFQNVTKVSSKIITSVTSSKSAKNLCSATEKNKNTIKYNNMKIKSICDSAKKSNKLIYDNNNRSNDKEKVNLTSNKPKNMMENSVNLLLKEKKTSSILKSKLEKSKDIFLEFQSDAPRERTYLVFRNEIENSRSNNQSSANSKPVMKNSSKNNYSPPSQNSSPCSSPSSIATVRPTRLKASCNVKNSVSPERNKIENTSSEQIESYKNKEYIKKSKSNKLTSSSAASYHNKENLPETSKNSSYSNKNDVDKTSRSIISDRNKNIFMLQMPRDSSPSIIRRKSEGITHKVSSTNTKLLKSKNSENHQKVSNSPLPKKSSANSSLMGEKSDEEYLIPEINNITRSSTPVSQVISGVNRNEQESCIENHTRNILKQSNSKINAAMKQLIDERLNFINKIQDNNDSDTDTIILSRDNPVDSSRENPSPISYKTVITNDNTCNITGSDIENAFLNGSFESYVESGLPSVDTDIFSFGSTESSHMSKFNPYSNAQDDMDRTLVPQKSLEEKAVRDIFERKDQHLLQTTGGVLAVQVFSGFSVDGEPVAGDQPEYISLVDPETGYMTLENARQVTSEEIFVSGRSSDTYESCYVEDDSYVPNWLFHVISQQHSAETPEEEHASSEAHDVDDQNEDEQYDANGNVVEAGFGLNVGAGDGRGMHSDQSQDSSGRGTSISSSDVSSGPHSEAILIDPSAFLGPTTVDVSNVGAASEVPAESSEGSFRTVGTTETDNEAHYTRGNAQRRSHRAPGASDMDADVSSLESDGAASDN